jgi:hypothetical protein
LSPDRKPSAIPLFGQSTDHSSVSAKRRTAVARSGGSRSAVRPARQRITLDGREHDGSLAISQDYGVYRGDFRITDDVERCSACRTSVVEHPADSWAGLRARYGLGADPYDPCDNILAGAA